MNIEQWIERLYALPAEELGEEARAVFNEFKQRLNEGAVRAAESVGGSWRVNRWVKRGILLGFRLGQMANMSINSNFRYYDKDTYPLKPIDGTKDNVRIVPGGSSIRDGVYIGRNVVIMPPAYINVGAYVDEGTLIDSHALVGSCAQIGKKVHLSAASQIGGVLEPVGALPVIIEDDVLVGGNCGIYEGTIVKQQAVIGAGTILTRSTPVYDLIENQIYRRSQDTPLVIPERAVVVAGSRAAPGRFAEEHGLSIYTPIIVKYRDEKTDAATALEDALR